MRMNDRKDKGELIKALMLLLYSCASSPRPDKGYPYENARALLEKMGHFDLEWARNEIAKRMENK